MSNVVYFTDKLTEDLYDVLDNLLFFATERYRVRLYEKIEAMIEQLDIHEDDQDGLFQAFIWMVIFCHRDVEGLTIYQHYLRHNRQCWDSITVKQREVLFSWLDMKPSFYLVTEAGVRSRRVFIFQDVFTGMSNVVYHCNLKSGIPKNGDYVSGLIMPFGEDYYITISRLIRVEDDASNKLKQYIPISERSGKKSLDFRNYLTLMKHMFKRFEEPNIK